MVQRMNNANGVPIYVGLIFVAALLLIGGAAITFQGSVQF